jgi:hypothetical protein
MPQSPAQSAPSFQPGAGSSVQDKFEAGEATYRPAVDLAQSTGGTAHVIQPVNDSINPKIDINSLLAQEDAAEMGLNPTNIAATNPASIPAQNGAADASNNNPTTAFPTTQ